jgi:hypothetical protein
MITRTTHHAGSARAWRALPAVAVLTLAIVSCRDIDVVTATYATLAEARQAGALDRGMISALLPAGAVDIREAHDPDSNRQWGLFNFAPSDADALRNSLRDEDASIDGVDCGMPGRIEWWPVILRGRINGEQVKNAGLIAHRARQGRFIVVVNWKQRRAYYWSE